MPVRKKLTPWGDIFATRQTMTRSLAITIFDKRQGVWLNGGGLGQSMRRDRGNDAGEHC